MAENKIRENTFKPKPTPTTVEEKAPKIIDETSEQKKKQVDEKKKNAQRNPKRKRLPKRRKKKNLVRKTPGLAMSRDSSCFASPSSSPLPSSLSL